jgi:hypothetical protein
MEVALSVHHAPGIESLHPPRHDRYVRSRQPREVVVRDEHLRPTGGHGKRFRRRKAKGPVEDWKFLLIVFNVHTLSP